MHKLNPILSTKQILLISTILIVLFLSYCSYGVYRTFNPGPETTKIADYSEMRIRFQKIYPWARGTLPPEIPTSASNISFYAFPNSVLLRKTTPRASVHTQPRGSTSRVRSPSVRLAGNSV